MKEYKIILQSESNKSIANVMKTGLILSNFFLISISIYNGFSYLIIPILLGTIGIYYSMTEGMKSFRLYENNLLVFHNNYSFYFKKNEEIQLNDYDKINYIKNNMPKGNIDTIEFYKNKVVAKKILISISEIYNKNLITYFKESNMNFTQETKELHTYKYK
jgi:hypothetical protein